MQGKRRSGSFESFIAFETCIWFASTLRPPCEWLVISSRKKWSQFKEVVATTLTTLRPLWLGSTCLSLTDREGRKDVDEATATLRPLILEMVADLCKELARGGKMIISEHWRSETGALKMCVLLTQRQSPGNLWYYDIYLLKKGVTQINCKTKFNCNSIQTCLFLIP